MGLHHGVCNPFHRSFLDYWAHGSRQKLKSPPRSNAHPDSSDVTICLCLVDYRVFMVSDLHKLRRIVSWPMFCARTYIWVCRIISPTSESFNGITSMRGMIPDDCKNGGMGDRGFYHFLLAMIIILDVLIPICGAYVIARTFLNRTFTGWADQTKPRLLSSLWSIPSFRAAM